MQDKDRRAGIEVMLDELVDNIGVLNSWEQQFVESLVAQWDDKQDLSERQYRTLCQVYDERLAEGRHAN